MGGEEFSVLLPDCSIDKAIEVAERIRENGEAFNFKLPDGKTIHITVSIGIAVYPTIIKDMDKLIGNADSALYEAKKNGRNRVVLYNNDYCRVAVTTLEP